MFFDKVFVENSELRRVWRAGFGIIEEPEENTSFPNFLTNLNECVRSEDPNPRSRLSLRTSSVLVEGAARIYRQELSRLVEDLSEVDRLMENRDKRKSTDSERDTPTDSSNSSVPYDTPEQMRRQIPRYSDVSIQKLHNEFIASLKADFGHSLSSVNKQSSRDDGQNGQSAKRRKMTDEKNRSTEYPSSLDLTNVQSSEDPISDEAPNLADDNQNILEITEQPTKNANADSDDQADSKTDQNETEKSSEEENADQINLSLEYPSSPDHTTYRNSEDQISNEAPNLADEELSSAVRFSHDDVVKDSDNGRVCVSPILPSRKVRNSIRGTKVQVNKNLVNKAPIRGRPASSCGPI